MKVFVINRNRKPLMPCSPRKARLLLKQKKATIYKRTPFTIKLVYGSAGYTQDVNLGIDAGYKEVGFSARTEKEELISGELQLLAGMSERVTEKRKYRTQRRSRLRHRKPRFDNRKRADGWLAPSIQHKLDSHVRLIERVKEVLPVSKTIIEVANFDIQKIKNPQIEGSEYQNGEQNNFWNLREYILHRDGHKCQNPNCRNKSKQPILEVHHLGFWKEDRSDRPGNLITLCDKCHTPKNHKKKGFLYGWQPKVKSFRPETFMSTVKKRLSSVADEITFGYITKSNRIKYSINKTHYNDAFVISGGSKQTRIEPLYLEQIRRHKRSMEQFYDAKYIDYRTKNKESGTFLNSGRRVRNESKNGKNLRIFRGHKVSEGSRRIKTKRYPYKQGDLVQFEGKAYEVIGMQNKGKGVKIANYPGVKNKVVKSDKVISLRKRSGICVRL